MSTQTSFSQQVIRHMPEETEHWELTLGDRHIECIARVLLYCFILYERRKKAQSVILLQSLCRKTESVTRYGFDCVTDSFVLVPQHVWYASGNQWGIRCHNSAIKWWLCLSDNCLPAQWQASSIITFTAIDVTFAFIAQWLAKQLLCKPFTTSATVFLIYGATLNLTNLTGG